MCTDAEKDQIYKALGNVTRREIMKYLRETPGLTSGQISENFEMSRIAVLGHIKVLTSAGLIIYKTRNRRRVLYFNPLPVQMVNACWVEDYPLDDTKLHKRPQQNLLSILMGSARTGSGI